MGRTPEFGPGRSQWRQRITGVQRHAKLLHSGQQVSMMGFRSRCCADALDAIRGCLVKLPRRSKHGMVRDGLLAARGFENQVTGKLRRHLFQILEMLPGSQDVLSRSIVDH